MPYDTGGTGKGARGKVILDLNLDRTWQRDLHAYVVARDCQPLDVPELDVAFTLPARKIGPLAVELAKADAGHWVAGPTTGQLPFAGSW